MQLQRRQQQRFVAIVVATASLLGLEFAAAFTVAPSSLIRSNGRRHILHGPLLDRPHLSLSAAAALEIIDGETAAATGTEVAKTTTTPLFASSPDSLAILEELGIEDGKLALGLKPAEVLQYIGTREDLIVKTLKDVPAFDRLKAETEVDKFLLDYEMMNLYIQYGKEIEKDPDFVVPDNGDDDEGFFSLRTVVVFYLAYVAVTTIPEVTRRFVAEQQVAGTWKATNIPFLDEWIESTTPEATARVLQAAEKVATAAAATNGDALQNIVADVVQAAASGLQ